MKKGDEISIINSELIKSKIYIIRGQKVMLDKDLAEIYGYQTKRFNEQVKNNIEKFDEDFMFQLTSEEVAEISRSNFSTLNKKMGRGSNIKYNPYVFTEQGIYMLMTVLKGELATIQSKSLIRIFKKMKDYIIENNSLISYKEFSELAILTNKNSNEINLIKEKLNDFATKDDFKKVMENFVDENSYKHFLIMNGQKIEANIAYTKIYKTAKKSIYIVDNYIGLKTLELLRVAKKNVKIIIFSDNLKNKDMMTKSMINDFKSDYPNLQLNFKITNGKYHDRYIAIDYNTENEIIYHCGASSKDAGNKIMSITKIEDTKLYHNMFDELVKNEDLVIK